MGKYNFKKFVMNKKEDSMLNEGSFLDIVNKKMSANTDSGASDRDRVYENVEEVLDDCYHSSLMTFSMRHGSPTNCMLYGLPGVGKTSMVQQWVDSHPELAMFVVKYNTMNNYEVAGVVKDPDTGKTTVQALPTGKYAALYDDNSDQKYVLVIDEYNRASQKEMDSISSLINERELPYSIDGHNGSVFCKNLVFTIIMVNPVSTELGTNPISAQNMDRFTKYTVTPNVSKLNKRFKSFLRDCADSLISQYPSPDDVEYINCRYDKVVEFIDRLFCPGAPLSEIFTDAVGLEKAYRSQQLHRKDDRDYGITSPRTLEKAMQQLLITDEDFISMYNSSMDPDKKDYIFDVLDGISSVYDEEAERVLNNYRHGEPIDGGKSSAKATEKSETNKNNSSGKFDWFQSLD